MTRRSVLVPLAVALLLSGGTALAQSGEDEEIVETTGFAGSYLAGRIADSSNDLSEAARFYMRALDADPGNPSLLERALMLSLATGRVDDGFRYALQLLQMDAQNPVARIAVGVQQMGKGNLDGVALAMEPIADAPLAELTTGLIRAWALFGLEDVDGAVAMIDSLDGPSWFEIFKNYHRAIVLDAAGRTEEALDSAQKAYDSDGSALRIVDAYARILARAGRRADAIDAMVDFAGADSLHPSVRSLLMTLRGGLTPPPIATTAEAGAAEVLYGLGTAIGGDDGPELPAAYLRLSQHLHEGVPIATMAIGDIFQDAGQCDEAIAIYETVSADEPLRRSADIQIGNCLESMDRFDEAAAHVQTVIDANEADYEAAIELGNIYRADHQFTEAADAYSLAVKHLPDDVGGLWRVYYFRGIAYERSKQWPLAEADFKKALDLNPDQPHVLNYLGYSWVDMGENLEPALDMIRTAVELRPGDGYIVDSLGWAYYRLERFEEAVVELERAVELRPEDPIINDHLGDAFWQVGRKREAMFQWTHARDLEPEEDDLEIILAKLQHGLDIPEEATKVRSMETETEVAELQTVQVASGDSLWSLAEKLLGDGRQYPSLLEANKDIIADENLIFPGMELTLPSGGE